MSKDIAHYGGIGRLPALALVLMVCVCLSLIGVSGYVKYELDRAEYSLSSAQETTTKNTDQSAEAAEQQIQLSNKKIAAERSFRTLSLILTMLCWFSLIIAMAATLSIYLALQQKRTPALRALAQSVGNLAKGDMETPVWGMERSDVIGELARAIDLARYHFSQLPDMSLLSDQGPIRIKFEGGARSLFEAMIQQISNEASRVRNETTDLAETLASQQKILAELPLRLNAALEQIQHNDKNNELLIKRVTADIAEATNQLNQLVPYMQSRAQGMAEVTQIAGNQVAGTLRNLLMAERELKQNAQQNNDIIKQLTSSTSEMGERIFAALNIMQASGKVLQETVGETQSRFNQAVDSLSLGENNLKQVVDRVEKRLEITSSAEATLMGLADRTEHSTSRMDELISRIEARHESLSEQTTTATLKLDNIIASFEIALRSMNIAVQTVNADGDSLKSLLGNLRENNQGLMQSLQQNSSEGTEAIQQLSHRSQQLIEMLEKQISQQQQIASSLLQEAMQKNQLLASQADQAAHSLNESANSLKIQQMNVAASNQRLGETIDQMGAHIEAQAIEEFTKTALLAQKNYDALNGLGQGLEQTLQRLDILGQLTNTLGGVAGQLGQLIPALASIPDESGTNAPTNARQDQLENHWHNTVKQLDFVRDDLSNLMTQQKDQLEIRLALIDKQIKAVATQNPSVHQQTSLMQDIVSALDSINHHLMALESETAASPFDRKA